MIHQFFPTLVYQSHLKTKLLSELALEARQIETADVDGRAWSQKNYALGYTSYGSLDQLHQMSSTFEKLEKAIDGHIKKFAEQLELDIDPSDLKMRTCW